MLIVPIQTSIVIPALIDAYTLMCSQNGSKKMIPSPPKRRWAQATPKSALAAMATPAMTASEVSAK